MGSLGSPIIITAKLDLQNNEVFVINWNDQPRLVTLDGQLLLSSACSLSSCVLFRVREINFP